MPDVPVAVIGNVAPETVQSLAPALRAQRALGDALAWLRSLTPPRSPVEIVTQDEYTHDVVAAAGDELYVVYDTT